MCLTVLAVGVVVRNLVQLGGVPLLKLFGVVNDLSDDSATRLLIAVQLRLDNDNAAAGGDIEIVDVALRFTGADGDFTANADEVLVFRRDAGSWRGCPPVVPEATPR